MEAYEHITKVVAPKKESLKQADAEYTELMKGLEEKRAKVWSFRLYLVVRK